MGPSQRAEEEEKKRGEGGGGADLQGDVVGVHSGHLASQPPHPRPEAPEGGRLQRHRRGAILDPHHRHQVPALQLLQLGQVLAQGSQT